MTDEMQTVVSILADGWGLSELSVHEAMHRDETVRKRIERIAEGNGSEVDLGRLNSHVKLVLLGEKPEVI